MLHIDVRTPRASTDNVEVCDVIVEVSNDGAPWHLLATFSALVGESNYAERRANAEQWAKAWLDGARYAGALTRSTSHGYNL